MKKFLAVSLAALMLVSTLFLAACGKTEKALKLGLGVNIATKASDATADKNGQGQATSTIAAVLVDDEGKIVKCEIDCADNKAAYTADGKAVANDSFKTKYELGDDYNMKARGGSAKEWFEQADAFEALVVGKTAAEVKALLGADNKGTEDVINAGCTITIDAFVAAVEKAVNNAAESSATASSELKLGVFTEQSVKDATDEKDGQNQVTSTIFAAALGADGKVLAATSDCVQVKFTFNKAGASTFDATKQALTKKELKYDYNMKSAGAALEWFEQAAAFDAACLGKTISEITGMMGEDTYGNDDLKAAGCTIKIDGFVKAAEKLG